MTEVVFGSAEPRPPAPMPYHRAIADLLERENPKAFAALMPGGTAAPDGRDPTSDLDQALLRHAYRLDPAGHPIVHAATARARTRLGITAPVEVFATEGDPGTNAELIYAPGRAVVLVTGGLLNVLGEAELCAVIGHELAHHLLWSADGGRYLAATRLLDAAETDARTPHEYVEAARRFRLVTEFFADRGALAACGSLAAAVGGLLKASTALQVVDPEAYLRQAAEVDLDRPSTGSSHPETVLRAWALRHWMEDADTADAIVEGALAPQLDLTSLDLLDQDRLRGLTQDLVRAALADEALDGDAVGELAIRFGVPAGSGGSATVPDFRTARIAQPTRRYLAAVLVDLATADPEAGTEAFAAAVAIGRRAGVGQEVERLVRAELGLGDRALTKLFTLADGREQI